MNLRYPYAALGMSLLALAVAGCGTGGASTATTEKPSIPFGSPALTAARAIPAHYKCDNRTIWLPLKWGTLPGATKELAVYIVRFAAPKAVAGGKVKARIEGEALIVGLQASLHELKPGKLPHGALVAIRAKSGVPSICPPKGVAENLLFRVYAIGRKLHLTRASKVNPLEEVIGSMVGSGTFIARYRPA